MKMISIFFITGLVAGAVSAERIVYNYDKLNRLSTVNYQNQAAVQYKYDATHNLETYSVWSGEGYFRAFMLYLADTGKVLNYVEYLTSGYCPARTDTKNIFNMSRS